MSFQHHRYHCSKSQDRVSLLVVTHFDNNSLICQNSGWKVDMQAAGMCGARPRIEGGTAVSHQPEPYDKVNTAMSSQRLV
jgi:hypothetical protein